MSRTQSGVTCHVSTPRSGARGAYRCARLQGHVNGVVFAVALADVVQLASAREEGVRAQGVKAQTMSVETYRHHPAVKSRIFPPCIAMTPGAVNKPVMPCS